MDAAILKKKIAYAKGRVKKIKASIDWQNITETRMTMELIEKKDKLLAYCTRWNINEECGNEIEKELLRLMEQYDEHRSIALHAKSDYYRIQEIRERQHRGNARL